MDKELSTSEDSPQCLPSSSFAHSSNRTDLRGKVKKRKLEYKCPSAKRLRVSVCSYLVKKYH